MRRAGSWIRLQLVAVLLLVSGQMACASRTFTTIPAYWVEYQRWWEPLVFFFWDLYFTSPTDGWVVGDDYLLQIAGGNPSVTFTEGWRRGISFHVVRVVDNGDVWAGGKRKGSAAIWRYSGEWRQVVELPEGFTGEKSVAESGESEGFPLSELRRRTAWVTDMEFSGPENGFALVVEGNFYNLRSVLLEYRRGAWRILPLSLLEEGRARLLDLCLSGDSGWAVGFMRVEPSGSRPLALRYENGQWQTTQLPEIPGPYVSLSYVVCDPRGGAYLAGTVRRDSRVGPLMKNVLLRYTDRWERVEVPDPFPDRKAEITAIALADDGLWVAMSELGGGALYAYHNGSWSRLPYPSVEEGRTGGFTDFRLQVFPGEAWAIANSGGRGLLFHYANGRWTNKNWDYSDWRYLWSMFFGH